MDDLAVELGISKKTLYAYFPGKFDLLEAVLADKLTGVEATLNMRQKAPDVFKLVERRRAALIQRYMGKFFVDGQRLGMVRKDVPAKLIIEILLAMVQSIMNPPKMEELGMMPKEGYTGILKIVLEGALTPKGRKA